MSWNFQTWYQEYGGKLNETRRNRYDSDPEYKDRVLRVNKESRERRRKLELLERRAEKKAVKFKAVQLWKQEETIDAYPGKKFLTVGALIHALGRSKMWVRLMEKRGIVPVTPYRNSRGDRLYLPEDIIRIKEDLEKSGRLKSDKPWEFARYVVARIELSDGSIVETPLFRVGVVAEAVGRSLINFEHLEKKGIIPVTPFRLKLGRRCYILPQIESIKQAFDKRPGGLRGEAQRGEMRTEISEAWREAKLDGAKVLEIVKTPKKSEEQINGEGNDSGCAGSTGS